VNWRRLLTRGILSTGLAAAAVAAVIENAVANPGDQNPPAQTPPAEQTIKKAIWGPATIPDGTSAFPIYRDLGVGIYEAQVHWSDVALTRPANPRDPNDPAYQWPAGLDQTIAEAGANGMQVSLMLMHTPGWANGGQSSEHVPDNPSDFADFAYAAAKRYRDVHLWMIWGEPNRAANFKPMTPSSKNRTGKLTKHEQVAPHNYAQLLDAAYGAIKSINPADMVIGGDTFTSAGPGTIYPYQWAKYMTLPDGSRPRMDMWGHNPFSFRIPTIKGRPSPRGIVTWPDLKRFLKALDKDFPGQNLQLFLAEWGVPVGFKDKDLGYSVSERYAADWIHAGYRIARKNPRIYTLGWVHFLDTERSSQGLFTRSGKDKTTSYNAYKGS
jgi:hypothetical protein